MNAWGIVALLSRRALDGSKCAVARQSCYPPVDYQIFIIGDRSASASPTYWLSWRRPRYGASQRPDCCCHGRT